MEKFQTKTAQNEQASKHQGNTILHSQGNKQAESESKS